MWQSLTLIVAVVSVTVFAITLVATGVNEDTAPSLVTVVGILATMATVITGAFKADSAARKADVAALNSETSAKYAKQTAQQTDGILTNVINSNATQNEAMFDALSANNHGCHDPFCDELKQSKGS